MDPVVALKLASSLDTFPGGGNLDENALLLDSDRLVERNELLGLRLSGLLVEGQTGVDLGGDTAGDDCENLLAEFDELRSALVTVGIITRGGHTRRSMAALT